MGIGDGRQVAAATVAGGAGDGAGALRPDPQHAAVIDPDDAAASGAYGNDVVQRCPHRQTADCGLVDDLRRAFLDQADIGAGAAHVERDQVPEARPAGLSRRPDYPRGGTGEKRRYRVAPHAGDRLPAAVRLHETEPAAELALGEESLEALEIAVDDGPNVSRDDSRRGALVLTELAGDVGRRRYQDARKQLVENLGDARLVRWIDIGVDETHGDGLECPLAQGGRQVLGDGVLVQGHGNGAVGEHALADLEAVASVHQRGWLLVGQVEHTLAIVALQEQDVPEARRRHEGDPGAAALQDGVGDDGGAVHQVLHLVEWDGGPGKGLVRPLIGALWHARHLEEARFPVLDTKQIRERAPDFNTHAHQALFLVVRPGTGDGVDRLAVSTILDSLLQPA